MIGFFCTPRRGGAALGPILGYLALPLSRRNLFVDFKLGFYLLVFHFTFYHFVIYLSIFMWRDQKNLLKATY